MNILDKDDRVERTDGAGVKVINDQHSIMKGIPRDWPEFLGYQKILPREEAEVLALIGNEDPLIVIGEAGQGKSMAFATDLAPHWGTDFVKWEYYAQFWHQAIEWLTE